MFSSRTWKKHYVSESTENSPHRIWFATYSYLTYRSLRTHTFCPPLRGWGLDWGFMGCFVEVNSYEVTSVTAIKITSKSFGNWTFTWSTIANNFNVASTWSPNSRRYLSECSVIYWAMGGEQNYRKRMRKCQWRFLSLQESEGCIEQKSVIFINHLPLCMF